MPPWEQTCKEWLSKVRLFSETNISRAQGIDVVSCVGGKSSGNIADMHCIHVAYRIALFIRLYSSIALSYSSWVILGFVIASTNLIFALHTLQFGSGTIFPFTNFSL